LFVPESTDQQGLDEIADELYGLPPDEFVPARDDRVAAAKEAGDRDLARALARLRRPTKAAWLANLLARHRAEQLDGLVALARSLTQAQQELDGDALRALSGQRHRAVAAMARDAGRLAARRGEAVNDALLREVSGILDAALADPAVAEEVRAGRLTKTVRYSGFGPAGEGAATDGDDMAAWAVPQRPTRRPAPSAEPEPEPDDAEQKAQAERERRAAERTAREQELADAEAQEAAARAQQESDEADRDRADERHAAARDRVAELSAALDAARTEEQAAQEALRTAAAAARESAREAATAAVRTTRARSRLDQLPPP
jgi:hypothetical protein